MTKINGVEKYLFQSSTPYFSSWVIKKTSITNKIIKKGISEVPSKYQLLFEQKQHSKLGLFAFVHSSVKNCDNT